LAPVADLRLIALDRCFKLRHRRALRIVLLPCCRQLVFDEGLQPREVAAGILQTGLISGFVCLGLRKLSLIWPRIDLH
jgi:hypothetical protein